MGASFFSAGEIGQHHFDFGTSSGVRIVRQRRIQGHRDRVVATYNRLRGAGLGPGRHRGSGRSLAMLAFFAIGIAWVALWDLLGRLR